MEKQNSQLEHGQPMEQTRDLHVRLVCGFVANHNTSVNSGEWARVLHGQVSLAAANQIGVTHEAMNSCKNLKIH